MKRKEKTDTDGNTIVVLVPETPEEAASLQAANLAGDAQGDDRHSFGDDPGAWTVPPEEPGQ